MRLAPTPQVCSRNDIDKCQAIGIIVENARVPVAAESDVIYRPGKFDKQGSGHGGYCYRAGRQKARPGTGGERLDRFTLRGRDKVDRQWKLYCMVHNIEKLAHHGYAN